MHRLVSISRAALIVCLVLLFLAAATAFAQAPDNYVLHEDVTYWQVSGVTVAKVQQTVYDESWTQVLKDLELIPQDVNGYLYSYTVTNLSLWDSVDRSGIKTFEINWGFKPNYIIQTDSPWTPVATDTGPKWTWNGARSGLIVGRTAEGLWAFAGTGVDEWKTGRITGGALGVKQATGNTTGPVVPEPASLVGLLSGTVGLFGLAFKRRLS